MQEQDSLEDPPVVCRHGKDALGRPVVADGLVDTVGSKNPIGAARAFFKN